MDVNNFVIELRSKIKNLRYGDESEREAIQLRLELLAKKRFGKINEYERMIRNTSFWTSSHPCSETVKRNLWNEGKNSYLNILEAIELEYSWEDEVKEKTERDKRKKVFDNKKIFIVHGHNETLKYNVANWLREIGISPIILHETANRGTTSIINKIEENSEVGCAIILMTADDEGKAVKENQYKKRARQNVVFEAGYFIGKLGPERVIILKENDVDIAGDLLGCVYIEADPYNGWRDQVKREFKAIGIQYKE